MTLSPTVLFTWTLARAPLDLIPGVQLILRSIDLLILLKSKEKEKWGTKHLIFPSHIKITIMHAKNTFVFVSVLNNH